MASRSERELRRLGIDVLREAEGTSLLRHAHRPRFVELVVGNTVASRDRLDKTIREIEDQEAEEAALTSDIKVASMREKKNGQLLFADRAGKLAALAASGRRIINDMNKISRAA